MNLPTPKLLSDTGLKPLKILVITLLVIAMLGIGKRVLEGRTLKNDTNESAIRTVSVIEAQKSEAFEEIILPGNLLAWHEATIYARTNGYIKKWYVDIGTAVKKDQLLAIIETPEVDAQLRQAKADLKTAMANSELAQSTASRWLKLLETNSVTKQEADERVSAAKSTGSIVIANVANRDRLQQLTNFQKITAPFDGIITSRTTDVGALIDAGSNTTFPLFHIVQANRLRLYINIPQNYAARISARTMVTVTLLDKPTQSYPAKLIQTARAINPDTRTLLAEFEIPNPTLALLAGSYVQTHLKIPSAEHSIILPVNTLLFRAQGMQVATVTKDNKIELKKINIANDYGNEVEISGIQVGEKIVMNPPDSIEMGETVKILQSAYKAENKKI